MTGERFTLRALYLYAVCLITLLTTLFSVASAVRNTVELAYPDPGPVSYPVCDKTQDPASAIPCGSAAAEQAERDRAYQRRWNILDLVGSLTIVALAAPTYLYHWRRIQRDHPATGADGDRTPA